MKKVVVPFNDWSLVAFEGNDGVNYVAIKPICEAIGIASQRQCHKILSDPKYSQRGNHMVVPSAGGPQTMVCLPVNEIAMWLGGINSNKVKPEVAPALLTFQRKCHEVLHAYFSGGENLSLVKQLVLELGASRNQVAALVHQVYELASRVAYLEAGNERRDELNASFAGSVLSRRRQASHIH